MRYSFEIKKFFYSQYVFSGLRVSLGLALPPIFCLLVFHQADIGFVIASGAISASVVDLPGPLKHKHNEMLACSALGFLSALASGFATISNLTMWLTVVPLTFLLSLLVVYPNRGPQISFGALFMMIINIEQHFTPVQAITNALWLLAGSLWYTYFSYFWNRLTSERTEQQAIAEAIFATAEYMRARARFYDIKENLDDVYRELVAKQIAAVERQDAARDIVLRNLPHLEREGKPSGEWRRVMLFNLFINSVDLHDTIIGSHTDYGMLRQSFGEADILLFFRDLVRKSATELEAIGLAVLQHRASAPVVTMKAELRAIEYEIDKLRRKDLPNRDSAAYATVAASYRRVWSVTRLIDRMHRNTQGERTDTDMTVDQALSRFLVSRRFSFKQLWTNLTPSSPSFRHALRVTLAVAVGLAIGKLLPLTNSYWIVLTTVIIMKPGFSLTRQRNAQRMVGTVIGCAAALALIAFVKDAPVLLAVMFACMFMAYSLVILHYGAATVFISAYVLLLYHLLAPAGMRLIGERAIDTLIGGALAIGISYLYANWEYRLMGPLVKAVIRATRAYLGAVVDVSHRRAPGDGAGARATPAPAAETNATPAQDQVFQGGTVAPAPPGAGLGAAFTPEAAKAAVPPTQSASGQASKQADEQASGQPSAPLAEKPVVPGDQPNGQASEQASGQATAQAGSEAGTQAARTAVTDITAVRAVAPSDTPAATVDALTGGASAPAAAASQPSTAGPETTAPPAAAAPIAAVPSTVPRGGEAIGSQAARALDYDFRYRLARKDVHIAFANLGQAFLRMMREPRSKQRFVAEFNELLIQSHALASQINAIGPLVLAAAPLERRALDSVLQAIGENLAQAENGAPLPADYRETARALSRSLDEMVVDTERAAPNLDGITTQESIESLKALVHHCKQMLSASQIVRQDASTIRL
ncbi:FUSC family protein [Chitinasiproducens palmae]|nr:FUSC family membrane protein [Chitinasiproducens palmae]